MQDPADPVLYQAIIKATTCAITEAEIILPSDVQAALRSAREKERNPVAQRELDNILENIALAERIRVPLCQDTGVLVCYVTLPPAIAYTAALSRAIGEGVLAATQCVPLRPNVVDPCSRKNTGTNSGHRMPVIHVRPNNQFTITVLPKGAGSENVSRSTMLLPSQTKNICKFVLETVLEAGGKPCPPVILGVGIGSTFDGVAALAKEALLEPIDQMNVFEQSLCDEVNSLGIGPMGLGGNTTALGVKVKVADCHTASLPVAVNIQCWACRRATAKVEVP
ncbi:MAG: fumarate hydratase [Methanomicrobiales archaeon]|nr:fumarate hydratase [Methanomicrobiales archaeon]